jgi:4'-phosphopantetheinyl transferase
MPHELIWNRASLPPLLPAGEVHVWVWALAPLPPDDAPHLGLLSKEELVRYGRFRFAPDRARFALSHANLRRILASYLRCAPEALRFELNQFGKPRLDDAALEFNLSHSKTVGAVAIGAAGEPLGLDVEDVRPIEPEVAESHFSAAELADLAPLAGDAWLAGFYRCWTRKEAILKAEGVGLGIPLDAFDVTLLEDEPAELRSYEPRSKLTRQWVLHNLPPAEGTAGALALAHATVRVRCFQVPAF